MKRNNTVPLIESLCTLNKPEEFALFLTDLCTPQELEALEARWQAAQLITQGHTIRSVNTITKVSTATITRVNKCLNYGAGYKLMLKKLKR